MSLTQTALSSRVGSGTFDELLGPAGAVKQRKSQGFMSLIGKKHIFLFTHAHFYSSQFSSCCFFELPGRHLNHNVSVLDVGRLWTRQTELHNHSDGQRLRAHRRRLVTFTRNHDVCAASALLHGLPTYLLLSFS